MGHRALLRTVTIRILAGLLGLAATTALAADGTTSISLPRATGLRYEAMVPDTLDLAERALLAFKPMLAWAEDRILRDELTGQGTPSAISTVRGVLGPKYLEAFPMIRVMTGSEVDLERERKAIEGYISETGPDGLFYNPPFEQMSEPWANVYGQGRLMLAWMAYYQLTGDKKYYELLTNLAKGLEKIAITKGDYAYYPTELIPSGVFIFAIRKSGWKTTDEPQAIHRTGPDQILDMEHREGHLWDTRMGIPAYVGGAIRGMPRWYEMSGDKNALELSAKIIRYLSKPEMWTTFGEPKEQSGEAHAHYSGHLHAKTITLRSMLDYAIATRDVSMMQFVREGYEYTRSFGYSPLGWVPEWTNNNVCEGCQVADMVALAVRLSEAGVGDYWEDADRYVRNQLTEMEHIPGGGSDESLVGTFAAGSAVTMMGKADYATCCTPNCAQALYYAWDAIVRWNDGTAQVNLLLNRASKWLDVDSYLPYEGKVVLHNKLAKRVLARVPLWADPKAVQCTVNGKKLTPVWNGNYLLFESMSGGETITIEFPMKEYTMKLAPLAGSKGGWVGPNHGIEFTMNFKGNTVVDISPRQQGDVPFYQRSGFKANQAPMKKQMRFASDVILDW